LRQAVRVGLRKARGVVMAMRLSRIVAGSVTALALVAGGGYSWVTVASNRVLAKRIETHSVDFPIPFPLGKGEAEELGLDEDQAAARASHDAIARGRHLVEARYGCAECHGRDFGGGVMVDAAAIGRIFGPNLTRGDGGVTSGFEPADWDRIVRHGVGRDGRPSLMPSGDYELMSDQELSDVVAYVSSQPPVDRVMPPVRLGPLGRFLIATGRMPLSANLIGSHAVAHSELPPAADASVAFGRHLAGTCTGCHGRDLTGGPIPGGDPSWAPASNLTPHDDGLAGWRYEDFVTAMREGRLPDGTSVRVPMTMLLPYGQHMTDVEMRALWSYLRSVPALATGEALAASSAPGA